MLCFRDLLLWLGEEALVMRVDALYSELKGAFT